MLSIKLLLPGILGMIFLLCGCQFRKQEEVLDRREKALNEKEQQLNLKEKTLELKEAELHKREYHLDSAYSRNDVQRIDSSILGNWNVKMTCTETTCPGSAVGDVRSENWLINSTSNTILVKAMSNRQLVRIYSGFYSGNNIELTEDKVNDTLPNPTRMVVRLSVTDSLHMDGRREITRDNCKVIYDLVLEKERMK